MAEPIISMLLGSVINLLKKEVKFILDAQDDLKELKGKLQRLHKALKYVDLKPFLSNQHDRDREGELKDVLYDAQDIIEEYQTKIELSQRGKDSKLPKTVRDPLTLSSLGKKIKEVNQRLDQIKGTTEMMNVIVKTTPQEGGEGHDHPRETTHHIGSQLPIGRDGDKEEVKNLLFHGSMESGVQEEHGVSIISIVGQGGIGKTTLEKMVFGEVEEQFRERRWWVYVSKSPNQKDLLQKILKEVLKVSERDLGVITSLSLSDLHTPLRSELSKERFLLVLDDVWGLDWWHGDVEGALMSGKMGSKILITTRNEDVSKGMKASSMHKLPQLTFDQSWDLFLKMASKEESELVSHNLKDIATNIVKKCGGLPLVVQTVGSLMHTKKMEKDDWETVEKSEIWEWKLPASSCGILPGLILSYDDLPPYLRNCFIYCCIYPKDCEIERDELVRQWVAHGLIEDKQGIDVEVRANQYIEELERRSLIEKNGKGALKLHYILHELASYIGGEEYSHPDPTQHTRHLSLVNGKVDIPCASGGKYKLRTLLSDHDPDIIKQFNNFQWLRVLSLVNPKINKLPESIGNLSLLKYLDLSHSHVSKLPTSIGNLSLLKYLDLSHSHVSKLPTSIGGLCKLQTMNLNYSFIEELPEEMGELCNLRYLGLESTSSLEFIAEGLGKLSNLQTLKRFLVCNDRKKTTGCNIGELKGLNKLKGELSIEGLGGVRKTFYRPQERQLLKEKHGLSSLKLKFEERPDDRVASAYEQSYVLEALEPPHGLESLVIHDYKGHRPSWFLECSLKSLEIRKCDGLNTIGDMHSLKSLKVDTCGSLEQVADMPTLESLTIDYCKGLKRVANMPALESLKVFGCGRLEQVADMPALKSLTIEDCEGLKMVANMPALEKLMVYECKSLEQVPRDMHTLKSLKVDSCGNIEQVVDMLGRVDMPALKSLTVRKSNGPKIFTNMPALESLEVDECGGLEQVADLRALNSLVVKKSNGLKTLANMHALESLEVDECGSLEQVADMPALKSLTVRKSNRLKTLPNMPALESLEVEDCSSLKLVAGDMPALKWSRLSDLYTLKQLSAVFLHLRK